MTPALWGGLITFVVLMAGVIGFWMSPMGQRLAAQQEAQQRLVVCRSCGTQGHCTAKRGSGRMASTGPRRRRRS
jgi:hypothetical protein